MSAYVNDFAALAQEMQNFFNAVDWRTDISVHSAAAGLESVHGTAAPIEAMVRACEAMHDTDQQDCRFWLKVYRLLISPEVASGGHVTLH
ncbi:MAG: hypothetical protein AAF615_02610 [Pseudomonadota bacterium]